MFRGYIKGEKNHRIYNFCKLFYRIHDRYTMMNLKVKNLQNLWSYWLFNYRSTTELHKYIQVCYKEINSCRLENIKSFTAHSIHSCSLKAHSIRAPKCLK